MMTLSRGAANIKNFPHQPVSPHLRRHDICVFFTLILIFNWLVNFDNIVAVHNQPD